MSDLIRTFLQQNHLTNLHHEISLRKSESFLYLEAMTAHDPMRSWHGECGVLYGVHARKLFMELYTRHYKEGARIEPFKTEAAIIHGATVSRNSLSGERIYDVSTDIESVTLYFRGHRCLELFISDLESCLAWAA